MRKLEIERVCEHTFVSSLLRQAPVVVDLGANRGAFSIHLIEKFAASVYAAEPVPELYEALPRHRLLQPFGVAIAGVSGPVSLFLNSGSCATLNRAMTEESSKPVTVPGVSLDEFFERYLKSMPYVDLLKMDIEGAEIEALSNASADVLRKVGMLTVEFHDFCDVTLGPAVRECIAKLESRGFHRVSWSMRNTDVLFINRSHHSLSILDEWRLEATKWSRGALRRLQRALAR